MRPLYCCWIGFVVFIGYAVYASFVAKSVAASAQRAALAYFTTTPAPTRTTLPPFPGFVEPSAISSFFYHLVTYSLDCQAGWDGPDVKNWHSLGNCLSRYPVGHAVSIGVRLLPGAVGFIFCILFMLWVSLRLLKRHVPSTCISARISCYAAGWGVVGNEVQESGVLGVPSPLCFRRGGLLSPSRLTGAPRRLSQMAACVCIGLLVGIHLLFVPCWHHAVERMETEIVDLAVQTRDSLAYELGRPGEPLLPSAGEYIGFANRGVEALVSLREGVAIYGSHMLFYIRLVSFVLIIFPLGVGACYRYFPTERLNGARWRCVLLQVLSWLYTLLYGVAASALFLGALPLLILEGEISMREHYRPGVFTWAVDPYCRTVADLDTLVRTLTSEVSRISRPGCTAAQFLCDDQEQSTRNDSFAQFYCPGGMDPSRFDSICPDPGAVLELWSGLYVKRDSFACWNATTNVVHRCNLVECATLCRDKRVSSRVADGLARLERGRDLYNPVKRLLPFGSCEAVVQLAMSPFSRVMVGVLGLTIAGVASVFGMVGCILISLVLTIDHPWMGARRGAADDQAHVYETHGCDIDGDEMKPTIHQEVVQGAQCSRGN